MKMSILARLGAAVALTAGLVFGAAPAQAAAPQSTVASASQQGSVATVMTPDYDGGSTDTVCATSSATAGQSALLPVARWADATTNMHSRLDGGILTDSAQLLQRNGVTSAGMGTGNFMWNLGTGMAQFAINFCIMNSAGGAADQIGSNIGKALLDPSSGVIAGIVVIVAVIFLARGMRRGSVQWKNLMMKGVIVGLFVVMVAGASASTGGGKDGSTAAYKPGVMSPGWIITGMNTAVGSLASAPAAALSLDSGGAGEKSADPLSCRNYVTSMKEMYVDRYGSGGAQLSSGVPLLLSGMWERAGLSTWRTAQFNSVNNGMDANVYCHVLEHNAGSTIVGWEPGTVQSIMIGIMGGNTPSADSNVWKSSAFAPTDNVRKDRSAIAWSECALVNPGSTAGLEGTGAWKMSPAWEGVEDDKKAAAEDCKKFFADKNDSLDKFDWPSNGEETSTKAAGNADVRTFVRTLHGNDNSQGITSVLAYNVSAAGMMIVFGGIAAAIIVAKIAMVLMIIIIFFMLLAALSPTADMAKLGGALKTILGMNVFVFLVQLIFAFIAVFTKLLQDVGGALMGGDTSLVATIWSGLAPLMAVGIMHMMFTKVMKVPSPFSISGGLSWGSMMGGAMGGAAFTGVSSLLDRSSSRLKNRATGAAKGAARGAVGSGKAVAGSAMSKVTGGRVGGGAARKGAANPAEAGKGGTGSGSGKSRAGSAEVTASDLLAGQNEDGTAKIDYTELASSSVKNSDLAKGAKTHQERKIMQTGAAEELKAAIQHDKDQKAALGIVEPTTAMGKVKDRMGQVRSDFKERPLRTVGAVTASTAKYAAIGGLAATGVGVVPAALIMAGGAAAKAATKHGYSKSNRGQRAINNEKVDNLRAHILKTRAAEEKARKNSGGQAPAEPRTGSSNVVDTVASPGGMASTGSQGAGEAPVVRTTSSQPATTPIPVTPTQPNRTPRVVQTNSGSGSAQQPAPGPRQTPQTGQPAAPARELVAPSRPSGPAGQ